MGVIFSAVASFLREVMMNLSKNVVFEELREDYSKCWIIWLYFLWELIDFEPVLDQVTFETVNIRVASATPDTKNPLNNLQKDFVSIHRQV